VPDVLDAVHALPQFAAPACVLLREVSNSTGHGRSRSADGLIVSCWPSRGIWAAGIEVKEHRSDWLRELKDPSKAHAIARYCNYWWLATSDGVAKVEEVPANWGLIVVGKNGKAKVIKPAPESTPEPWSVGFAASVLRNSADATERYGRIVAEEAVKQAKRELGEDAMRELRGELVRAQSALDIKAREAAGATEALRLFRDALHEFERDAGLPEGSIDVSNRVFGGRSRNGPVFKALLKLREVDVLKQAQVFDDAAKALRAIDDLVKPEGDP
jgi:hypothetical protein